MRSIAHDTWTEYHWDKGDMVRLKTAKGVEGKWDHVPAGAFGRVVGGDDYMMEISLHGYSNVEDSIKGFVRASRFDLVPWERSPEDEEAIQRNARSVVRQLAWMEVATVTRSAPDRVSFEGYSLNGVGVREGIRTNDLVLSAVRPHLVGIDPASAPQPRWLLNEEAHALLDSMDEPRELRLAGGGNRFELHWNRRGAFKIKDLGTDLTHVFEGEKARELVEANRREVRWLHDNDMPRIAREALPYPRSLRIERTKDETLAVVELDESDLEIRRGDEAVTYSGEDAKAIRQACKRIKDLGKWLDRNADRFQAVEFTGPALA